MQRRQVQSPGDSQAEDWGNPPNRSWGTVVEELVELSDIEVKSVDLPSGSELTPPEDSTEEGIDPENKV